MSILKNIYQYPGLSSEELDEICGAHQKASFKKGDYLLKEGQISNEYYCLENGLVRSFVINLNGIEITTSFFGKNEIVIDVVSLFQRVPSRENLQALTDCVCWKIDFDRFQSLYHSINGFSEWGRFWMTQSLFQLKQRTVSMITESASNRYLALQKQYPDLLQHVPLKHIASYLGITDTSLSRIRRELTKGK